MRLELASIGDSRPAATQPAPGHSSLALHPSIELLFCVFSFLHYSHLLQILFYSHSTTSFFLFTSSFLEWFGRLPDDNWSLQPNIQCKQHLISVKGSSDWFGFEVYASVEGTSQPMSNNLSTSTTKRNQLFLAPDHNTPPNSVRWCVVYNPIIQGRKGYQVLKSANVLGGSIRAPRLFRKQGWIMPGSKLISRLIQKVFVGVEIGALLWEVMGSEAFSSFFFKNGICVDNKLKIWGFSLSGNSDICWRMSIKSGIRGWDWAHMTSGELMPGWTMSYYWMGRRAIE